MSRRHRQQQILSLLETAEELDVDQACERLEASPATIRREFAELAKAGRVEKTWGGIRRLQAVAPGSAPAFAARLVSEAAEKKAIARAAAELLEAGDVVMIDGGTTTLQLAEFIAAKRIRVITNSLVIAQAIDQHRGRERGAEIHLAGGLLQPESGLLAGPQAEAFLQQYRAKWAFLGAAGIDESAATNYHEVVLASEHIMIARSSHIAILADHTKLGRQAMRTLCPVEKIDRLFTGDLPSSRAFLTQFGPKATAVPF